MSRPETGSYLREDPDPPSYLDDLYAQYAAENAGHESQDSLEGFSGVVFQYRIEQLLRDSSSLLAAQIREFAGNKAVPFDTVYTENFPPMDLISHHMRTLRLFTPDGLFVENGMLPAVTGIIEIKTGSIVINQCANFERDLRAYAAISGSFTVRDTVPILIIQPEEFAHRLFPVKQDYKLKGKDIRFAYADIGIEDIHTEIGEFARLRGLPLTRKRKPGFR